MFHSRLRIAFISALTLSIFTACQEVDIQDGRLPSSISVQALDPYVGDFYAANSTSGMSISINENRQVILRLKEITSMPESCIGASALLKKVFLDGDSKPVRATGAEFEIVAGECRSNMASPSLRVDYLGPKRMGRVNLKFASETNLVYTCPSVAWDANYDVTVLACEWVQDFKTESIELIELQMLAN